MLLSQILHYILSFSQNINKHVKQLSTDVFKFYHLLENVNKNVELSKTALSTAFRNKQIKDILKNSFSSVHYTFIANAKYIFLNFPFPRQQGLLSLSGCLGVRAYQLNYFSSGLISLLMMAGRGEGANTRQADRSRKFGIKAILLMI